MNGDKANDETSASVPMKNIFLWISGLNMAVKIKEKLTERHSKMLLFYYQNIAFPIQPVRIIK